MRTSAQVGEQPFCLLHEVRHGARQLCGNRHAHGAAGALIEKDLDAVACISGARTERTVTGNAMERALYVFATTQAVDAVVVALTGIDALSQGADLDHVAAAARRGDAVVAERSEVFVEGVHLVDLGAAAPPAALDLVFIGRDPSVQRGWPLARPPLAPRFAPLSCSGHVV